MSSRSFAIPKSSTRDDVALAAAVLQHHVVGLEIAVDDRVRVRIGERGRDLDRDRERAARRQRRLAAWITVRSDRPSMSSIAMNSVPSVSWPKS